MQNKLDQLTGLRFLAAFLVFLSHSYWYGVNSYVARVVESGYVGVSFFFLLSGFVLSFSYRLKIKDGRLNFVSYMLLRLARITPLHSLTALPFLILALYAGQLEIGKLVVNLLYLQSWIPSSSYYFSFNAPSWSLSNEMFFYACFFPFVLIGEKSLWRVFAVLLVMVVLSAFAVQLIIPGRKFFGGLTFAHWLFYIFPGFRLLEFVLGMLLFSFWRKGFRLPGWVLVISYPMLAMSMYFAKLVPEPFRMSLYFLPFVVIFFYSHLSEGGGVVRFFSTRLLILLGNSSFAFYLIHQRLIGDLGRVFHRFELSSYEFVLLSGVAIALVSVGVYVFFERWAEAKLKSLIIRRSDVLE